MDYAQIEALVKTVKGTSFVGIDTETVVKTAAAHKALDVRKQHTGATVLVHSYENSNAYQNAVNRALEAAGEEPNFEVGERPWGERDGYSSIIVKGDKKYLQVIFKKPGKSAYTINGKPATKAEVRALLTPSAQKAMDNPSSKNGVVLRSYKLESITGMRIMGENLS